MLKFNFNDKVEPKVSAVNQETPDESAVSAMPSLLVLASQAEHLAKQSKMIQSSAAAIVQDLIKMASETENLININNSDKETFIKHVSDKHDDINDRLNAHYQQLGKMIDYLSVEQNEQ